MNTKCQEATSKILEQVTQKLAPAANHYELLGVPVITATNAAISSSYQKLHDYYQFDNLVGDLPELAHCDSITKHQVMAQLAAYRSKLATAKDVLLEAARRLQYDYDTFVR